MSCDVLISKKYYFSAPCLCYKIPSKICRFIWTSPTNVYTEALFIISIFPRGYYHGPQIMPLIYVTPQLFARLRVSRIIPRISERDPIQRMVDEFSRHKKKKKKNMRPVEKKKLIRQTLYCIEISFFRAYIFFIRVGNSETFVRCKREHFMPCIKCSYPFGYNFSSGLFVQGKRQTVWSFVKFRNCYVQVKKKHR